MMNIGLVESELKLNTGELDKLFREKVVQDIFICTEEELNLFEAYGYVIKNGDSYVSRYGKTINLDVVSNPMYKFNINFSKIIGDAVQDKTCKLIYYMSNKTFDRLKVNGCIVQVNSKPYFRIYENELWLVKIL